ncbi:MAG TPA: polysaccharide lyase [Kiloniellaceae bacterium]|nr:polysaccharide lyase [Kiloniellaceae bacterium]
MHIRATKAKDLELNEHHTEIEPKVRTFTKERSANIGSTYWYGLRTYLEDWTSESSWEIIAQWHGMADGEDNTPRNPPVALAVRNGHYLLYVRADSAQATAPKDTANRYDREDTIDLGPIASNTWVDWAFKIKWDPFGTDGSISVWQNGNLIYEEYGQPNTFNDTRGPIWYMGIYKFFSGSNVSERRIRLDDIRVATVGTGDPDSPPDTPGGPGGA